MLSNFKERAKASQISIMQKGKGWSSAALDEQQAMEIILSDDPSAPALIVAVKRLLSDNPSLDNRAKVKQAVLNKLRIRGVQVDTIEE
ncbi:hypothetical protein HWV62_32118 [Athelia sp. TMB]|nr:hypothetical protein HWV62_32118 [Athelia sp. TMB]